jgi:hypothetical protein
MSRCLWTHMGLFVAVAVGVVAIVKAQSVSPEMTRPSASSSDKLLAGGRVLRADFQQVANISSRAAARWPPATPGAAHQHPRRPAQ